MKYKLIGFAFLLLVLLAVRVSQVKGAGTTYYVSNSGSDSNSGTSEYSPWQSLSKVNGFAFQPGDKVLFRRGDSWTGSFNITKSGASGNPITFAAYGSGKSPVFENPGGGDMTRAINISADWVVIDGFLIRNTKEAAIYLARGANNNIIQGSEMTDTGLGVKVYGQYNLITRNNMHDLHVIRDTPGGYDDVGPVGVWIYDGNNEVSYNRIINCKVHSYDFGEDGGTVEIWASTNIHADNNYIHHNYAENNKGFSEFAGQTGGTINNTVIAYNVMVNNDRTLGLHLGGGFGQASISNVRLENNTIVDVRQNPPVPRAVVFSGDKAPTAETLKIRNNIFYLTYYSQIANKSTFTHDHNLYFLGSKTTVGFNLDPSERVADPLFENVSGFNLHLRASSPAINTGANLGYSKDFDDRAVPFGGAPDMGAYEYQSGGSPPSPTATPTPKIGDVNQDGKVNIVDIGIIIDNYSKVPPPNPKVDINKDGIANIVDIGIVIDHYEI